MTLMADLLRHLLFILAASAAPPDPPVAIVGGTLIDGTGGPPVADAALVISGGRIATAGTRAQVEVPKDALVVDAKGCFIVPGLVDAHVHFFQSGGLYTRPDVIDLRKLVPYAKEIERTFADLSETFRRYLASGVTAVADVGGPFKNFEIRTLAEKTEEAPRVTVAGPLVSTYAPQALASEDPAIIKVNSPDEARALVKKEVARKPDFVKIWFIHRQGDKLEDQVPIVKATVDESHAAGIRVAVHATELEVARAAVLAGADILVHSVNDRLVDDAFVKLLKERNVIYTTTIVVSEGYREVLGETVELTDVEKRFADPEVIGTFGDLAKIKLEDLPRGFRRGPRRKAKPEVEFANVKTLVDAGVAVAAGTDAGNIGTLHGPALHREIELLAEAGLSPMQVIVAATRDAARVTGINDLGVLQPGMLADLLVLDADPLLDVKNLRRIRRVVKAGKVHDPATLVPEAGPGK